jgi:hypothetical protein
MGGTDQPGLRVGPILTEQTCYNSRLQVIDSRLGNGKTSSCADTGNRDVLNLTFGYGSTTNNGNLLSQTIARGAHAWSQNYSSYDSENRLTYASEGSNWSQSYGYGGFGNRAVTAGYIPNTALTATGPRVRRRREPKLDFRGTGDEHVRRGKSTPE